MGRQPGCSAEGAREMERAEARFRSKIVKRQDLRDVAFYLLDQYGENG